MLTVLEAAKSSGLPGLDAIIALADDLSRIIADDTLVQAGTRLISEPNSEFSQYANNPFFRWIDIVEGLARSGKRDGSIPDGVDAAAAAEAVNALFIGEQVLAGLADSWASLPARIERMHPYFRMILTIETSK